MPRLERETDILVCLHRARLSMLGVSTKNVHPAAEPLPAVHSHCVRLMGSQQTIEMRLSIGVADTHHFASNFG